MRKIGLALGIVALVAAAVWIYRQNSAEATRQAAPPLDAQTIAVQRGDITATVPAVGNLAPGREANVVFASPGRVAAVYVTEGDSVAAGRRLAALDTTDLEWEITSARMTISIREAELARLQSGPNQAALDSARAQWQAARQVLTATLNGPSAEDISAARSAVAAAQAAYDLIAARPRPEEIRQAELRLEQAKNSLWNAQNQRDIACDLELKSRALCDSQEALVGNGHVQIQLAELALEQAKLPAPQAELAQAASQVRLAQAQLDKLLAGASEAEIAAARAQVVQAQAALEQLTAGPSAEETQIAQTQLDLARLNLDRLQQRLDDAVITAPFAGVVSAVNYRVGDVVRPEQVGIALVDVSALRVKLNVAEIDIGRVQIGQAAEIVLDAFPDTVIEGTVASIAPAARVELGVVNYPVTIALSIDDPALKPGMTGNVNIIAGHREGVLLVPNRAIRRVNGQYIVTRLEDGRPVDVPVRLGLSNDAQTEIISGLAEGDRLVVNLN